MEQKWRPHVSSVFTDLEVPDFLKAPLSLSGIVVHAEPGLPGRVVPAVAALAPPAPTTLREFSRSQQVTAFVKVYEGAELRLNIPADRLPPGPYLLKIEASREMAAPVRRTVRFQMN